MFSRKQRRTYGGESCAETPLSHNCQRSGALPIYFVCLFPRFHITEQTTTTTTKKKNVVISQSVRFFFFFFRNEVPHLICEVQKQKENRQKWWTPTRITGATRINSFKCFPLSSERRTPRHARSFILFLFLFYSTADQQVQLLLLFARELHHLLAHAASQLRQLLAGLAMEDKLGSQRVQHSARNCRLQPLLRL